MVKSHAPGVAVLLLVLAAAWFGLRLGPQLGPQTANRPATMEAATGAAQGFVETSLKREYEKRGQSNVEVIFAPGSTIAEPDPGTEQSVGNSNLWIVSGTATARTARGPVGHIWQMRERWEGNGWRLKTLEIVGPKAEIEKGQ